MKPIFLTEEDIDKAFYNKISPKINGKIFKMPEPTMSPEGRLMRRMSWRNDRTFFKRKRRIHMFKVKNAALFPILIATLACIVMMVYIPAIANIFHFTSMGIKYFLLAWVPFSFVNTPAALVSPEFRVGAVLF